MHIKYSTPHKYFERLQAVNKDHNRIVDQRDQDFFPYADNKGEYWTGFYSSRPGLKYKIRQAGRYL